MKPGNFCYVCLGAALLPKIPKELFVHFRAGLKLDDLSFCQFTRIYIILEMKKFVEINLNT